MTTQSTEKKYKWLPLAILIGLVLTFCLFYTIHISLEQSKKLKQNEKVIQNLVSNSTEIIKLNGEQLARTKVLEVENSKFLSQMEGKDAQINRLIELSKQYSKELKKGGMVMTGSTDGEAKGSTETEVVFDNTEIKDTTSKITYPTYKAYKDFGGWASIRSIATKDSTYYEFSYRDSIDVVVGRESKGMLWWKKESYFADFNSRNPFNRETSFRVADIKMPKAKDKFFLGLGATYGITNLNNNFGLGYTIGATLGYKLVSF